MTMDEVRHYAEHYFTSDTPIPWVNVESITGTDPEKAREMNRKFYLEQHESEEETDDEIIVDFFHYHLLQQPKGHEDVTGEQLIQTIVYLIIHFWSGAATNLAGWEHLLNRENANACLHMIKGAFFRQDEWLPKMLLSSLATELFAPRCEWQQERNLLIYLDKEHREFIEYLFHDTEYTLLKLLPRKPER